MLNHRDTRSPLLSSLYTPGDKRRGHAASAREPCSLARSVRSGTASAPPPRPPRPCPLQS